MDTTSSPPPYESASPSHCVESTPSSQPQCPQDPSTAPSPDPSCPPNYSDQFPNSPPHSPICPPYQDLYPPNDFCTHGQAYSPSHAYIPSSSPGSQYYSGSPVSPGKIYVVQTSYGSPGYIHPGPQVAGPYMYGDQQRVVYQQQPAMYQSYTTQIALACTVFWCCGWILGLIAFILAVLARSKDRSGRPAEAANLGKASLMVSIAGIVVGLVVIGIAVGISTTNREKNPHYYYSAKG